MKTASGFRLIAAIALAFFEMALIAQNNQPPSTADPSHSDQVQTQTNAGSAPGSDSRNDTTRIMRVQSDGTAQVDRNTGTGFEPLVSNMPITQGNRLQTGDGVAEVQFEDASTLRITPNSLVEFSQLTRSETGAMTSQVNMVKGTAYLNLRDNIAYGNNFLITFGEEKLQVAPGSYLHVSVAAPKTQVVVFAGEVRAEGPSGTILIGPKKTLIFQQDKQNLASLGTPVLKKGIRRTDFDEWDQDATKLMNKYAKSNRAGVSPYQYGMADLNYYGQFINDPTCGQMWQPYFVSSSWDPYSNGMWVWYPKLGYSWVSVYPWGWLPYHYGSWNYCGARGWGWQPGGQWNAIQNVPTKPVLIRPTPAPIGPRPVPPPHPPQPGRPSIYVLNSRPLVTSQIDRDGNMVIRRDSAGLGIPRGFASERSMMKLSNGAAQHGFVSTPVADRFPLGTNPMPINNGFSAERGGNSTLGRPGVSSIGGARPVAVGGAGGVSRPVMSGGGVRVSAPSPAPAPAPVSSGSVSAGAGHK